MTGYPLCRSTVTVYRLEKGQVHRQVEEGCFFQWQDRLTEDVRGSHWDRTFYLVMPGSHQRVFPGDRVMAGEGPAVTPEAWDGFVPAAVEGLCQVQYACPHYWRGKLCHTEAGRK